MAYDLVRVYCTAPVYDEDEITVVGSCGTYLPGKTIEAARALAAVFRWELEPEPHCAGHAALRAAGGVRPVLVIDPSQP